MADDNLETQMKAALHERLAIIGDTELRQNDPQDHLARLKAVSERIMTLQAQLPEGIHPQLRHYFERCSYDKALAWIEAEGIQASSK